MRKFEFLSLFTTFIFFGCQTSGSDVRLYLLNSQDSGKCVKNGCSIVEEPLCLVFANTSNNYVLIPKSSHLEKGCLIHKKSISYMENSKDSLVAIDMAIGDTFSDVIYDTIRPNDTSIYQVDRLFLLTDLQRNNTIRINEYIYQYKYLGDDEFSDVILKVTIDKNGNIHQLKLAQ